MKRSEALKIIDEQYGEFVADWLQADINNLEEFMPLNERIFSALEEAGMRPPRKQKWDGVTCFGGVSVIEDWESEE